MDEYETAMSHLALQDRERYPLLSFEEAAASIKREMAATPRA